MFKSYDKALELLIEGIETLKKRHTTLKIGDNRNTVNMVNEFPDCPLVDDKDDTAYLRSAFASASRKRK